MRTVALLVVLALTACAGTPTAEEQSTTDSALSSGDTFTARGTGYYPDSSALEGGFVDRKGKKLQTLQQYLAGRADYVSVAMDVNAFSYGQHLRIKELEAKYGRAIDFRVVDTGGAFKGKGRTRIDICTASQHDSLDSTINGRLTITTAASAPSASQPVQQTPVPQDPVQAPPVSGDPTNDTGTTAPTGTSCASDGACNPGNDGSGLICDLASQTCVAGCHTDAQCPGVTKCASDGQCR